MHTSTLVTLQVAI